ncbi:solute carrier family 10 member 6-like [Lytechinus variegatus]|uniref:solute carrier family 10 member 6-like n=1 Tax=Lytechinus variegatus TaxID=7654 RepID=UPI001BB1C4A0|nr:solute carrier family 10 member 6-like [Lytechinus variegatus]
MNLALSHGIACWLVVILAFDVDAQCGMDIFVNVTVPEETVYVFEGSDSNTTIIVNEVLRDGELTLRSSNPAKFTIKDGYTTTTLTTSSDLPRNLTVVIEGRAISLEKLEVYFQPSGSDDLIELGQQTIGVKRVPTILQAVYVYIILAWIVLSYLSMGGSMNPKDIWKKIRRPYGILIGIFCQFIIMPAMTYMIALLLARGDDATSVGIVLIGTAPGGWLSNIFCALLDVDLVLSITMTFFSTLIALGMMPLNLLIYATPFTTQNQRLQTPFSDLAQQLAILVIPLFIGIAISWKFPKFKKFCKKVVKPIALLLIIIGIAMGVPADFYAFSQSPGYVWAVSFIIPFFGAFFGLSFARIFARDVRSSITIAIETGVQNAILARTIVFLFYPRPEADLLARVTLTTSLVTIIEGAFAVLVYYIFRYLLCRRRCNKAQSEDELDGEKAVVDDDIKVIEIAEKNDIGNNGQEPVNGADNAAFQSESK